MIETHYSLVISRDPAQRSNGCTAKWDARNICVTITANTEDEALEGLCAVIKNHLYSRRIAKLCEREHPPL